MNNENRATDSAMLTINQKLLRQIPWYFAASTRLLLRMEVVSQRML